MTPAAMGWTQVKYQVAADEAEALAALLDVNGALSVTLADAGDEPQYQADPQAAPLWQRTWVIGLYPDDADIAALSRIIRARWPVALAPPVTEPLADRQWERSWMEGFEAMRFGRRLWVVPHWLDEPDPTAVNVRLDPGLAFGTGTHATTALCLEWLDGRQLEGLRVLDYGCGSGILAIAALKLGAAAAWATDIDPRALEATRANAGQNGVGGRLRVMEPERIHGLAADIVLANILAGPLIQLAPGLSALVSAGGSLVLSGLLEGQAAEVGRAYESWFDLEARHAREQWALLHLKRRMDPP